MATERAASVCVCMIMIDRNRTRIEDRELIRDRLMIRLSRTNLRDRELIDSDKRIRIWNWRNLNTGKRRVKGLTL